MKKLVTYLALSVALICPVLQAAKEETTKHTKSAKKTAQKKVEKKSTHTTRKEHAQAKPQKHEVRKTKPVEYKATSKKTTKSASKVTQRDVKIHQAAKNAAIEKHTFKKAAPAVAHKDEVVGKTAQGKSVFEGARTGHYYLDDKQNKVYVHDFIGANIVGYTNDKRPIYQGPRGGHFYYTASGNKEYVKR